MFVMTNAELQNLKDALNYAVSNYVVQWFSEVGDYRTYLNVLSNVYGAVAKILNDPDDSVARHAEFNTTVDTIWANLFIQD